MAEYIEREAVIRTLSYLLSRVTSRTDYDRIANIVPNEHPRTVARGYEIGNEEAQEAVMGIPAANVVEIPKEGIGELSDGYHTFNELYHHRAVLFSVICNNNPDIAWKSKLHDTGDMFDGMFIVGIETPQGQATYHYDIEPYWDMFKVKELEKAPKWDGHTPEEAIRRIGMFGFCSYGERKDDGDG